MDEHLDDLLASWERDLRAADKSPETIKVYRRSVTQFSDWLSGQGRPSTSAELTKFLLGGFIAHLADLGREPATLLIRFKSLHRFCRWAVTEEVLERDPMAGMQAPEAKPKPVPLLPDEDVAKLLKACEGTSFEDRRDLAIVRVLFDTGVRLSECAGLDVGDVDLKHHDTILVHGKGGYDRAVPFGSKTGRALDRYLRVRRGHRLSDTTDGLWLGNRGKFTADGVEGVLKRRAKQAGLEHIHAHQLRHGFAHNWLAAGGQERDLKRLAGWRSDAMLERYGASAAEQRARDAHKRLRLGDRI